jgi:hypothetical protein
MATKKNKDNKGPATQSTGTQGVNAVGVNHGTKPNYAPGFTDVAGSPSYQQYGQQYPQQAPVVVQPVQQVGPQQVQPQTATNVQQNPVVQPVQTAPAANSVQPVQPQQFSLPQQITVGGKTITLQQPIQQGQMPQQVTIGNNTYQMPTQTGTNAPAQQPKEPTAAQQNAAYEAQKQQEAEKAQYNQLVDEYRNAGGNPNAIRQHSDPNMERMQPTAEQVQQAQANAQQPTQTDDDEYVKTLKEYLDSKYQSPEDRAAQEKREARQRRWAAISEGIANVFNVGGSVAGARPAQWKSAVGDLYANQEAESDKRRAEYREALRDMITYRNAIRNGDIARARAIEDKRRNDIYEYRIMQEQEAKAAERKIKAEAQEKDQARKDQDAKNRQRAADDKHEEHVDKKARGYTTARSSSSGGGGRKKSSGGSRATGAAAARSANASRRRVTKNRLKSLKNKNKK